MHFALPQCISITKIVGITYTISPGLSKRQFCKEYVRRKVNNVIGANLCQILPLHIFLPSDSK